MSVCCAIFSRDLPSGICTGYKRRFHRVYFSRVPKPDTPFRRLTPGWTLQRGPFFPDIYPIFVHSKFACSDDLLNEIEIVISPAICWLLGSEAPLSGGQTAPRVQTSIIWWMRQFTSTKCVILRLVDSFDFVNKSQNYATKTSGNGIKSKTIYQAQNSTFGTRVLSHS